MALKNSAKFFCENCNTEVKHNAKFCPKCGRFFASVKCPNCGKIGAGTEFTKGCPRCGYAVKREEKFTSEKSKKPYKNQHDDALPSWVYIFSILLLFGILALLIKIL